MNRNAAIERTVGDVIAIRGETSIKAESGTRMLRRREEITAETQGTAQRRQKDEDEDRRDKSVTEWR
jgi:hypothetical protein